MAIILAFTLWFQFLQNAHGADLIIDSYNTDFGPIINECFLVATMRKNKCAEGSELDRRVKSCLANQEKFNCRNLKEKNPHATNLDCTPGSLCAESFALFSSRLGVAAFSLPMALVLNSSSLDLVLGGCAWSAAAIGWSLVKLPFQALVLANEQDSKNMANNIVNGCFNR